ncbi:plasma kallikrein-like [Tigriopus californicus]|uniref:plasma kallikrein-like n=1 Tax=Tigriopus californicus TaxID=6832 RepID=UPI0027D9ECF5|nr:plasma kallikrein-like [Tigriopus californicus]
MRRLTWLFLISLLFWGLNNSAVIKRNPNCLCGVRQESKIETRITNGKEADPNEFPWMVGLFKSRNQDHPICGGVLISDRHILTAAHCLVETIRYGSISDHNVLNYADEGRKKLIRPYRDVQVIHPNYGRTKTNIPKFDLAILQFVSPVVYSFYPKVRPICLPSPLEYAEYGHAWAAGWGRTAFDGPQSDVLLKARLNITTNSDCEGFFKDTIIKEHLCTQGSETDTCQGDSGGALIKERSPNQLTDDIPRYEVIGITSWGADDCGNVKQRGGFARVSTMLPWIFRMLRTGLGVVQVCDGLFGQWFHST